jgi:hypothetical protein
MRFFRKKIQISTLPAMQKRTILYFRIKMSTILNNIWCFPEFYGQISNNIKNFSNFPQKLFQNFQKKAYSLKNPKNLPEQEKFKTKNWKTKKQGRKEIVDFVWAVNWPLLFAQLSSPNLKENGDPVRLCLFVLIIPLQVGNYRGSALFNCRGRH